jgi:hypothetical protein
MCAFRIRTLLARNDSKVDAERTPQRDMRAGDLKQVGPIGDLAKNSELDEALLNNLLIELPATDTISRGRSRNRLALRCAIVPDRYLAHLE